MSKEKPLRTTPRQERSRQRVDLILDTAAALFVEIGYEATTTNAIAERAGISIGSLYRYFPDKDTILRALIARYSRELRKLYEELFTEDAVYLPLPVLVDRVFDRYLGFYGKCPAVKHLLLGSDSSTEIGAAMVALEDMTIGHLKNFLMRFQLAEERAFLVALVCQAIVKAMFTLLTPSVDAARAAQIVAEFKHLLLIYLTPISSESSF
ncbi:MAG: TetR/AcrR family transcriptional regulator [Anaerolineae bacterium]|nr:TetR/AcrR family transcriptional regulator [Anaerolineae bacterium]